MSEKNFVHCAEFVRGDLCKLCAESCMLCTFLFLPFLRNCARRICVRGEFLRRVGGKSFVRGIFCVAVVFLCAEGNFSGGRGAGGGSGGGGSGGAGGAKWPKKGKKGGFWGGPGGGAQNGQFLSPSGTRVVRRALRPIAQGGKSRQNMH